MLALHSMRSKGRRGAAYTLQTKYFPGFDMQTMLGQDGLHVWADGITMYMIYWCFYMFIVVRKYFGNTGPAGLHKVNKILEAASTSVWSDGVKPPELRDTMLKGTMGNRPKRGGKVAFTAHQTKKFAFAR